MHRRFRWTRYLFLLCMVFSTLACVSIDYLIDMQQDASGMGTIYQTLIFPATDTDGESIIPIFDSYVEDLAAEGWDNIEVSTMSNNRAQISATYALNLTGGRNLPESLENTTLTMQQNGSGQLTFTFDAHYDYSEFLETWTSIKNAETYDFGPIFGDDVVVMSQEEINAYIQQYGEPIFTTRIRLPGTTHLEASGGWINTQDFLTGETDELVFSWTPGQPTTGTLHAVSIWSPDEVIQETQNPVDETQSEPAVYGEKNGMPCDQYCLSLDPVGFFLEGDTYPNCKCDCGEGNVFLQLKCIPYIDLCSGDGMRMITNKDGTSACMCTDPNKKYDVGTRQCVDLDGTECNHGNGCEPEYGENCSNCADCVCSFGSGANSQYDQYLTCNPGGANADIYGCVFTAPDRTQELEILREEWKQCRDAWALMNLAGGYGQTADRVNVMGAISDLQKVQDWQQKSGCIPTGGVVVGREEVDPLICLIRYCDRINAAIHEVERQISGSTPVVVGPAIKVNPPNAEVTIGPLQVPQFTGVLSLYGDRSNSIQPVFGAGFAESSYEIVNDPASGMQIYLMEGSFTYSYYDAESHTIKQELLRSGEMLKVDTSGALLSHEVFDPASRDPWWESADYLVNCPDNAYQVGPDCYCYAGYAVDVDREICVQQVDDSVQPTSVSEEARSSLSKLVPLFLYCGILIFIIILVLVIVLTTRKKKQRITPPPLR